MSKLILHIGSFKTGTTSIQDTFFSNSKELLRNNILYPMNTKNHRWLAYWDDGTRLSNELNIPKSDALKIMDDGKNFLSSLVCNNTESSFFISSEYLFTTPVNELLLLKGYLRSLFDEVVILAYVRNPSDMLTSWVSEAVKNGEHTLLSGMEKIKPYVALSYLYNYKDVFGLEAMIVRRYGREYFTNENLFDDLFLSCFGKDIKLIQKKSNESLTLEALLVAEKVNLNFPANSLSKGFIDYLYGIAGQKFMVPNKYIQIIDRESKPYLKKLSDVFGIDFTKIDISKFPENINVNFNDDVINSIAVQFNNLSLTKEEFRSLVKSARLLKAVDSDLSGKLKNIALKSNPEAIL